MLARRSIPSTIIIFTIGWYLPGHMYGHRRTGVFLPNDGNVSREEILKQNKCMPLSQDGAGLVL